MIYECGMHQPVEVVHDMNMNMNIEDTYIQNVMSQVCAELEHHGDYFPSMWVLTVEDKPALEYIELYIGEPNKNEMLIDHDAIMLSRAQRLNQIH